MAMCEQYWPYVQFKFHSNLIILSTTLVFELFLPSNRRFNDASIQLFSIYADIKGKIRTSVLKPAWCSGLRHRYFESTEARGPWFKTRSRHLLFFFLIE